MNRDDLHGRTRVMRMLRAGAIGASSAPSARPITRARLAACAGVCLAVCTCLTACKSAPPKPAPVVLTVNFTASADVNPDAQDRPSPVVVRLYELKDDAAFKSADIYALLDKEQPTLGAALIAREECPMAMNERCSKTVELTPNVHFVGVVAFYRDFRNAQWRTQIDAPGKSKTLAVAVSRASVDIAAK